MFPEPLSIKFAAIPSFIFHFRCLVFFYRTSPFGFSINNYFLVVFLPTCCLHFHVNSQLGHYENSRLIPTVVVYFQNVPCSPLIFLSNDFRVSCRMYALIVGIYSHKIPWACRYYSFITLFSFIFRCLMHCILIILLLKILYRYQIHIWKIQG